MADKIAPYINPILRALRRLDGFALRKDIFATVVKDMGVDGEAALENTLKSGVSVFENHAVKALRYLRMSGYINSPEYRYWELTEKGRDSHDLSDAEVAHLLAEVRAVGGSPDEPTTHEGEAEDEALPSEIAHRPALLEALLRLPPAGFERFCERLLRESGFDDVRVTGRSGDGGIDGVGVLRMNSNPFVSFRVLFQCKRYDTRKVGSPEVRDLHGAMRGRSDNGLILTTSSFTADAKTEASRDGAPVIELVDGARIVTLCESLRLGLIPRTVYDVDTNFFSQFDSSRV